ncbi:hypothetical protein Tco_1068975 [Tanacetum coccineum]|uniref:CCHC-type domain-containing protein n=1 Tax=Tanacetum coccineum TaxID=301880 RepID=A0ABQ5HH96_9ASTR
MNESPILKRLRYETIVKLITFHDNIWAVQGDDDALLFCGVIDHFCFADTIGSIDVELKEDRLMDDRVHGFSRPDTLNKNVKSAKEFWDSIESKYMTEDASNKLPPSWKDFKHTLKHGKDDLSLVQLDGKNKNNKQNKGKKCDSNENNGSSGSNKKPKMECWKCNKTGHFKRNFRSGNKKNNANAGDRCWFKTYEPMEDGSILYVGDDQFAHVHGKGSVVLEFSSGKSITLFNVLYVPKLLPDDSGYVYMSSSTVVNSSLWHARLGYVHYKRMLEMSKDDLIPAIDENPKKYDASRFFYVYLLHAKDEALEKFRIYKTEVELQQNDLIKTLRTDIGGEYYDPVFFQYAVVRLPDPKRKTFGEKGIDCIFVGYAKHSKAYRFYVIQPNDSVSINSIIESRDAIFDENRFSSIPRLKDIIQNSDESQRDDHSNDVPSEPLEPRRGKRARKAKSYGSDFQLYLVEGSRDQIGSQYSYCYSIEEDPRT